MHHDPADPHDTELPPDLELQAELSDPLMSGELGVVGEELGQADVDRAFLLRIAADLVAAGEPVTLVEREVRQLGAALGHPDLQVAATPTAVFLSLGVGAPSSIAPVVGPLRLDQSAMVVEVHRDLVRRRVGAREAIDRLDQVRSTPSPFPWWMRHLGLLFVAGGLSLILQPGVPNLLVSLLGSACVSLLMTQTSRHTILGALLPTVAAFVTASLAFGAYDVGLLEGPLRTVICPLAVLLPGALLVTGVTELATGSMVAGASRAFYAVVQLVLFSLGLVAAAMVVGVDEGAFVNERLPGFGLWEMPVGLAFITLGITLSEALPWPILRWSGLTLVLTFVVQLTSQIWFDSLPLGAFFGAVVASYVPTLLSRLRDDAPRLVAFLPSFWLLVPGTVGLMGVTQLGSGTGGPTILVSALTVVSAIALGMLVGSALGLPLTAAGEPRGEGETAVGRGTVVG